MGRSDKNNKWDAENMERKVCSRKVKGKTRKKEIRNK